MSPFTSLCLDVSVCEMGIVILTYSVIVLYEAFIKNAMQEQSRTIQFDFWYMNTKVLSMLITCSNGHLPIMMSNFYLPLGTCTVDTAIVGAHSCKHTFD